MNGLRDVPESIADVCFLAGVKVCHHKSWLHGTSFSKEWVQETKYAAFGIVEGLSSCDISVDYLRSDMTQHRFATTCKALILQS